MAKRREVIDIRRLSRRLVLHLLTQRKSLSFVVCSFRYTAVRPESHPKAFFDEFKAKVIDLLPTIRKTVKTLRENGEIFPPLQNEVVLIPF
jgi:hypothetical protein